WTVAVLVFAMGLVAGATRLTGTGLSLPGSRQITGALAPTNAADWAAAAGNHRAIPQSDQGNAGLVRGHVNRTLWAKCAARVPGRLTGVAFALPFLVLRALRRVPRRVSGRCGGLLGLGGLQGLSGWWMVSSGLSQRVDVAPERLAVHLGLALLIFGGLIWTG